METTTSNGEPSHRRVVNERLYVAVGRDAEESKSVLLWALDNFDGDFRIVHVHQPEQINTHGWLSDSDIRARRELESQRMHRTLDAYINICNQAKVHAEKRYLELRDIGKGIVELVEQHAVSRLVMGAAAERHFYEGMQELKSRKAIFVNEHAHPSCQIWFVCNKHVITKREGDLNVVDLDVTPSSPRARSTIESAQSNQIDHDQKLTIQRSYSSEENDLGTVRYERGETSASRSESNSPPPFENGHHFYNGLKASNSELYDQFERAMQEAANARAATDEMLRRQKAEKAAVEANCRVSVLENLLSQEERLRKELEEALVREGEKFGAIITRMQEELSDAMEQSTLMRSQVEFSDQIIKELNDKVEFSDEIIRELEDRVNHVEDLLENRNKERDELQIELDNARMLTEELNDKVEFSDEIIKELEDKVNRVEELLENCNKERDELQIELYNARILTEELNDKVEFSDEIIKELEDRVNRVEELLEDCSKERDELQIELDNAHILTEELLRNQDGQASSLISQQFLLPEFSFSEIQEATNNLDPSMKIEDRDYGTIYKGVLRHTQVAIKMLPSDSSGSPSNSQYHQELEVAKIRHPNLVTLIGVCPDPSTLVYEYLPNGSLEEQLDCGDRETSPLTWRTRLHIANEICVALTFLHSNEPEGIIHGDLKAENVWLDANFVSKLCDYGLSPALSHLQTSSNLTVGRRLDPSAEFPHMDPHFLATGELSTMSDVYSFGIILLRLLTGKLAINLPLIVKDAVERGNISDLLDPLARGWPFDMARELIHMALRCCDEDLNNRPDLGSEVLGMLQSMEVGSEISSSFQAADREEERQPPNSFICPISHDIMEEPLVAADGYSYDADSIRAWIEAGHCTSPMTNVTLAHLNLVTNFNLRSAIQEWQQMR